MEQWLREEIKEDCAVAFSGGVDSALLLKLVCDAAKGSKANVYAVTMQTTLHPAAEITHTKKVAEEIGARHLIVPVDELAEAGMEQNPVDRCYRCKKLLFTKLKEKAAEYGVSMTLEGTNAEDLNGYRPGFWRYGNWGSTVLWCSSDSQKKRCVHGRKNWGFRFPTVRRCLVLRHVFPMAQHFPMRK